MISSDERADELAALRRRAYGPDADIQSDADAVRRLHELEQLVRSPVDGEPEAGRPTDGEGVAPEPEPAASLTGSRAEATAATTGRGRWWRSGALWTVAAMSLVLGLGAGVAIAVLATPRPVDPPDQVLALVGDNSDRSTAWLGSLSTWGVEPGSVAEYESFDTLDVWVGEMPRGERCLLLSDSGRIFASQCTTKGLDPVLDMAVDPRLAVHFDGSIPVGTVIRFLARSDGVAVWVHPLKPDTP